jgi:hypothetical protein
LPHDAGYWSLDAGFLKDFFFLYPVSSIQYRSASSNEVLFSPTRRFEAEFRLWIDYWLLMIGKDLLKIVNSQSKIVN